MRQRGRLIVEKKMAEVIDRDAGGGVSLPMRRK
jgi:hypothetical protein